MTHTFDASAVCPSSGNSLLSAQPKPSRPTHQMQWPVADRASSLYQKAISQSPSRSRRAGNIYLFEANEKRRRVAALQKDSRAPGRSSLYVRLVTIKDQESVGSLRRKATCLIMVPLRS